MIIGGLQKVSLIDYPGKVSVIIFTQGCNFHCPYCHNPELVDFNGKVTPITISSILDFLRERKDLLDGLVISGGEPTLQANLPHFMGNLKSMDLLVKLDTNGSRSDMIKDLVLHKLVDYIAMDIKGPLRKYTEIIRRPVNLEDIKNSIEIIMNSDIQYEFRTTLLPYFHSEDEIHDIGRLIEGAELFCIQGFNPKSKTLDPAFKSERPFTHKELENLKEIIAAYVKKVIVR